MAYILETCLCLSPAKIFNATLKRVLLKNGPRCCQRINTRNMAHEPTDYSNFPKKYIKREMDVVEYRNPSKAGPQYPPKIIKNRRYTYTLSRPWEMEAKNANPRSDKIPVQWVEPFKEWTFYRGDRVEILVGKDKGKQGIINYMVKELNWVIVEGLNCEYIYHGKTADYPGMMIKRELPLVIGEEVTLVDPADQLPTEVEWRFTEQGEEVRVSTRTGRIIPVPILDEETYDYKTKKVYIEQPKDTITKHLSEITFNPELKTFEMDIMEKMGIKEDRIPKKFFWY